MAIFKCKVCGGSLQINDKQTTAVCDYCGTQQTLPKLNDEKRANLYDRANHFRRNNEFDKASSIYENILNEDGTDAEAYWSLVLCRYGIEYVEEPATKKRVPTVNRAQFTSVFDDDNYQSALQYADAFQKSIYEEEAKSINEIQKGILAISQNEDPFDIFICYKETDQNGRRTPDSVLATELYHQLTNEGFKVFFSRITLEDKLGVAYEPYIFAALNTAKVMVVLGTKPENFNAVWVKNEWSRFLALVKQSGGKKIIIPAYRDMDPYDIPEEFSHLQAQDMSKLGFMQDLIHVIKKIMQVDSVQDVKTETEVLQNVQVNVEALLERAYMYLEDGEWQSADEYCEKVLDQDPKNSSAYIGKLMAELHCNKQEQLRDEKQSFQCRNNYQKALRFADDELRILLQSYIKHIDARNEEFRKDGIYKRAKDIMSNAMTEIGYKKAALLFESISGYFDSTTLACECREKEIQKQAKRRKYQKLAAIIIPIVCIAVLAGAAVNQAVKHKKYNHAIKMLDSGDVIETYETLMSLDGYKESTEKAASIWYSYRIAKIGTEMVFGEYEQDNIHSNGKEAIEWIVLDVRQGKVLLVSKYALDTQPMHNEGREEVTWEDCDLREWLNGYFLGHAFSFQEQKGIAEVTVDVDVIDEEDRGFGNPTQDKVFLLSLSECEKFFKDDASKQCEATIYAQARDGKKSDSNQNCHWWLRTFAYGKNYATVPIDGEISIYGSSDYVFCEKAVRPALWIDLTKF